MNIACIVALRGTCPRARVGAVLARESRVISSGYNGSPSRTDHCIDTHCILDKNGQCTRTVHAELNCICFAAKYGIPTCGASLYTTHSPCLECAKAIINAGIKEVFYLEQYGNSDGLRLLTKAQVVTEQLYIFIKDLSSEMRTELARRNEDASRGK